MDQAEGRRCAAPRQSSRSSITPLSACACIEGRSWAWRTVLAGEAAAHRTRQQSDRGGCGGSARSAVFEFVARRPHPANQRPTLPCGGRRSRGGRSNDAGNSRKRPNPRVGHDASRRKLTTLSLVVRGPSDRTPVRARRPWRNGQIGWSSAFGMQTIRSIRASEDH